MNDEYAAQVRAIVRRCGANREKAVMRNPHEMTRGETWNNSHKVIHVIETTAQPGGHKNGFAVDLVTRSICG